uniref:Methylated-DNA--protein-cysteine methyltransferase n=1 Tax=Leptobrachium leishanense TaxID=445787 RepID=A0A8C5QJY7_9ANUR
MVLPMKQCANWLQTYFCEPWFIEKVPTPSFHHPVLEKDSFTKTVLYSLMKNVKMGDTVSYKRLAEIAGNDKAARAVGGAMRSNPHQSQKRTVGPLLRLPSKSASVLHGLTVRRKRARLTPAYTSAALTGPQIDVPLIFTKMAVPCRHVWLGH